MVTQELLTYIRSALAGGQTQEIITQTLISQGWLFADIQEGFRLTSPTPITPVNPVNYGPAPVVVTNPTPIKKKRSFFGRLFFLIFLFLLGFGISSGIFIGLNFYKSFKEGKLLNDISKFIPTNLGSSSTTNTNNNLPTSIPNNKETQMFIDLFTKNLKK